MRWLFWGLGTVLVLAILALSMGWSTAFTEADPARPKEVGSASGLRDSTPLVRPDNASDARHGVPSSAASPAVPDLRCTIAIRCEGEDGRSLSGAKYWLLRERAEAVAPLESSDSGDVLSLPSIVEGDIIAVRLAGFADAILPLAKCSDRTLLARMVSESALSGQVSTADGNPLRDFTLVAWPRQIPFKSGLLNLEDPSQWPAGVLTCKTTSDGRFAFVGARARCVYSIYGGGSGSILAQANIRVVAPREDLTWRAESLFAALVMVTELSGAPMLIQPGRGIGFEFGVLSADHQPMIGRDFDAVLAGLPASALVTERNHLLALVVGAGDGDSAGPCRVSIQAPGYESFQREFMTDKVRLPLNTVNCVLVPTATEFGSLTVRFTSSHAAPAGGRWPGGLLRLAGSTGDAILYRHPGGDSAEVICDRVPAGQYALTFQADIGAFKVPAVGLPPLQISISAGGALIDIPLPGLGWIDLDVVADKGTDYFGPLDLMTWRTADAPPDNGARVAIGLFPCSFNGPPYSIPIAEAGTYGLRVTWPERDSTVHAKGGDMVEVRIGERVRHLVSVLP